MLYWLTGWSDGGDFFNLFRYITFRAGGAFMTALVFGFIFGLPLINVLRRKQGKGQPIRSDGPRGAFHQSRDPDDGWFVNCGGADQFDPVVGPAGQPLCLDGAGRDLVFCADRFRR